ncbi:MAG: rRNA maturation RNase YbeY [Planctomycetota bacterium]
MKSRRQRHACTVAVTCGEVLAGAAICGRSAAAWRRVAEQLAAFLAGTQPPGEPRLSGLEIHLSDPREMAALNFRHLRHRGATDVLTFPLEALEEPAPAVAGRAISSRAARAARATRTSLPTVSGVVVVCPAVAEREARARKLPAAEELLRYLLHGALHLIGEDDKTAAARRQMHARQEALLAAFLAGQAGTAPAAGQERRGGSANRAGARRRRGIGGRA